MEIKKSEKLANQLARIQIEQRKLVREIEEARQREGLEKKLFEEVCTFVRKKKYRPSSEELIEYAIKEARLDELREDSQRYIFDTSKVITGDFSDEDKLFIAIQYLYNLSTDIEQGITFYETPDKKECRRACQEYLKFAEAILELSKEIKTEDIIPFEFQRRNLNAPRTRYALKTSPKIKRKRHRQNQQRSSIIEDYRKDHSFMSLKEFRDLIQKSVSNVEKALKTKRYEILIEPKEV